MGCSKNLVDSERVLRRLSDLGINAVHNADRFSHGAVIINTCGFIGDAKEESIETILEACSQKAEGHIDAVYVMGCLSERYRSELPAEIPEVDGWFGKFDWSGVIEAIEARAKVTCTTTTRAWDREITTPSHHAYLKIAEGCNRFCAFCAIPLITGRYHSRQVDEILEEVRELVGRGVKEFNVIAQDLSFYGHDLYGHSALAELVESMADIEGVEWIRLHYAYPSNFPYEILPVMARHKNVCKYLDIALQHISDNVLSNMRRHINKEETLRLIERIRREVPGIHLRTTLMVGFPGEGEVEFEELKEFVQSARFERMGAFAYCEEEDTYAAKNYVDEIPQEVKDKRLDEIMALQEKISLECNEKKTGHIYRVIVDREESDYYVGRTEYDSPEVDPEVLIQKTRKLAPGEFYDVCIDSALPFELIGTVVEAE